ncbi:hypothetical protein Tco_0601946 [Tanacetum coccineum]
MVLFSRPQPEYSTQKADFLKISNINVEISTASRLFSTAEESVSTVGASMPVSTAGMVQEVNISILLQL